MRIKPGGFTLFELILAIALSVALLALIGTAINLYLIRVDASRTRVEEAQLARSILSMIASDIRSTTLYEPQDMSAIAQLMANSKAYDVDSIDEEREEVASAVSSLTSGGSGGSSSGSSSFDTEDDDSSMSGDSEEFDGSMPLGLSGSLVELYIDLARLPSQEELFSMVTGYTNAPLPMPTGATSAASAAMMRPSDVKTVRYFVRQGQVADSSGLAATSLAPGLQGQAGGLVRQELPRPMRVFAEQSGSSAVLDSGQTLIAPEVVQLEFRYYDGQQIADVWDMLEEKSLPLAIEIKIWLVSPEEASSIGSAGYDQANLLNSAREYRQTVYLPMSEVSRNGAMGGSGGSSSSSSSSSFGSSSSTGSDLGQTP